MRSEEDAGLHRRNVLTLMMGAGFPSKICHVPGAILPQLHAVANCLQLEDKVLTVRPEKVLFFVRFRRDTRFFVAEPDWTELDEP